MTKTVLVTTVKGRVTLHGFHLVSKLRSKI